MVKKSNDKWKMCVDYTDLNDACPEDPYPLPNIDQLIDATSGHIMLSFMDAFSGYNQIKMNLKDIPKTTFITHRTFYAYVMFPFGLTSAGSTYQRAMNKIFKSQIGRNLECYVEDMITKSTTIPGHVEDLKECFNNLRKNQLKLNSEKCTFGVGAGKFLGFIISNRRIEPNPEKIKAIQEMRAPRTQKDVQKQVGSLAALERFVSKLVERCLPLFDLLKRANNKKEVNCSPEWQKAFEDIKSYLSQPPVLTKAQPGEPLYLHLSAGEQAVGASLIREENGRKHPVYYVSQVLKDAETRTAIKAQALADFIIEYDFPEEEPEPMTIDPETYQASNSGAYTLKVDGSSTSERSGARLILTCPEGFTIQITISFCFPTTNNHAEYEALISGLKLSRTLKVQDLNIFSDSQIVVKQINGEYIAKDPILAKYQALIQSYLASIPKHQVLQICQEENEKADIISKLVRNSSDLDCSIYFEELQKPSIDSEEVLEIESNQNWMTPFINYLEKGELPEDKGKSQRLKAKAAKFILEEGLLYRRTFSSPILKCIGSEEAKYSLMEVHEGICGDHISAKDLAHKIIRQSYYWPTIHQDTVEFVKKYKECQLFSNVSRISPVLPSSVLSGALTSWDPFPRPKAISAKVMRTINQQDCINFMDNILMRTSPRTSTGETPFKLAYGTEAMLPIEVGSPSHRAINFDEVANEEELRTNMELINEVRDQAVEKMERYKEKINEHFSGKSRVKNFQVGDLVLRDTEASDPTNTGNLMPKWEGPYKVKEVLRPGAYKLLNEDGSEVPNTWHGLRLRKFYQ
ncbi:uncharacterized protein LOC141665719 [Apium graveolens]|uniref:uncharacterized protein LOC141665719 n=1 Tax=Apium graveolens TaxID=4045 RepID=UPI003D7A2097